MCTEAMLELLVQILEESAQADDLLLWPESTKNRNRKSPRFGQCQTPP